VVVCFDCDGPGRTAAKRASQAIAVHAAAVRVIDIEGTRDDGYDVGDLLREASANGGTPHAQRLLLEIAERAEPIQAEPIEVDTAEAAATSWTPENLGAVLAGEAVDPEPTILSRTDQVALIYGGKLHQVSGEPESCKGWLALEAAAERLALDNCVLYLDFEDSAPTIVSRLRALGVTDDRIRDGFIYIRPHEPLTDGAARDALDAAFAREPELVVIDGVTEALTIHGLDLGDNADVARWLELLPRLAGRSGAAVVLVDHVVKAPEARGRYALGAQHKLAGVDVAYSLAVVEPFARGAPGWSRSP
jgi:hypothetical protein